MDVYVSSGIATPGIFVQPAGADLRSASNEEALKNIWEEVRACFGYAKPDGWRIQVHKQGEEIRLFGRSGKEWTAAYPSVTEMLRTRIKHEQAIIDTELVGFDQEGRHLSPDQLSNAFRYRCYLLDVLHLKQEDLTQRPIRERLSFMEKYLSSAYHDSLIFANYQWIGSFKGLLHLYQECRQKASRGFDGTIIKRPEARYFTNALKVKPEETVDAVVVGAYLDDEETVNKLLLAVPSHVRKTWVPIAQVAGKGASWNTIWSACQPYVVSQQPEYLEKVPHTPHVWVEAKVVVSVKMTRLKLGTRYLVHADAARECLLREDKGPREATSFEEAYQIAFSNGEVKEREF
ncbi:MAG: hypothetical protein H0W02_23710 [Ktedonobacteraceae bacterium]|nr:hypothetical protein [Ktedonobacteraceae bacterium]